MPNLMGVTNPAPNYDSTTNNRPVPTPQRTDNPHIQNVADPNRVVRPDGRTEQQGADNPLASNNMRYDSNLQVFLQQLRDMPELPAELSKVITTLRSMVSTPGLDAGIAGELSEFLQMFSMDEQQFQQFFLNMMKTGNRFGGPLFELLRQVYQMAGSDTLREAVLNFARRYSDFSSTNHIGRHMLQLLDSMRSLMMESHRANLAEMTAALQKGLQAEDRKGNLSLLQNNILPYLADYITQYHDMGTVRTLLSLLMLDIARYENGSEDGLMLAFRQLGGYGNALAGLNQLDDADVWRLLKETVFNNAVQSDQFAARMAQTMTAALSGRYGADMREAFQEILRALMINESVYMPLNHGLIPLEHNGKKLYSEFWVDPDAEGRQGDDEPGGKIQFLFKMDIDSLGFLEMTLAARGEQVDLAIYGPDALVKNAGIIMEDLSDILKANELTGKNIRVLEEKQPLLLTEVFPDLFEGKRSVNVKI